ncbi:MAG: hypothetical protein GY941_09660 [Planctomycetes bacterium]|nr:hypothetical protein [Planctomycetota bacterium]
MLFLYSFNSRAQDADTGKKDSASDSGVIGYGQEDEEEQQLDLSGPVELWTFVEDYRFVSGRRVHLMVQLLWKLGINVNTEQFKVVDLAPFKVDKVTIGEREIFNNDRDYQIINFTLSLPDDKEEGVYTVPSFTIPFRDEVNDIEGEAATSPVALKKVPIMIEAEVDKDVVTLGDRVHYRLIVWHEKHLDILKEDLKERNLEPFTLLDCTHSDEVEGGLKKLIIDYEISVYELADEDHMLEIPPLTVLYYEKTENLLKHEEDEALLETHEIKAPAVPVLINSMLKKVDVPLESIKGPVTYPQRLVCLRGHLPLILGGLIIVVLGVLEARKYFSKVSGVIKEKVAESPLVHAEKLEEIVEGFVFGAEENELRASVICTASLLRVFLGSLAEVPEEQILSFTTTKMLNVLRSKRLPDKLIESAHNLLKTFDSSVFGDVNKVELEKGVNGIKDLLKEAKRRGYY